MRSNQEGIVWKEIQKKANPKEKAFNLRKSLIEISLGEKAAGQYIKGGRVLNVYTGELLKENIAVYEDRIAYVGPSEKMIGKKTRVWEAEGKFWFRVIWIPMPTPTCFIIRPPFPTRWSKPGRLPFFQICMTWPMPWAFPGLGRF